MRIRYAYKLEDAEGNVSFRVISHHKSDEEVKEMFADKGIVNATFHERVRTGFRLTEDGQLAETGLVRKSAEEAVAPASPEAPKTKKANKSKKA